MEMSQVNQDDLEEKPLDPDMEKVRRKMVRLLAVSIGIMFIGLMAVLGAIVYKFTQDDAAGSGSQIAAGSTMALPGDDVSEAVATLPQGSSLKAWRLMVSASAFSAGPRMDRSGSSFMMCRWAGLSATSS
jgi:hypothetical protein